jgi:hypothetical protein
MNPAILLELAARWERDAKPADAEPGGDSEDAISYRAMAQERRETKRECECADALRSLISLLA